MIIYSEDNYEVDVNQPTRECLICGKLFNKPVGRNGARVRYCPRQHYSFCEICGERFNLSQEQIRIQPVRTTCSRKCLNIKVIKTAATSAGVPSEGLTNISQIAEIKAKMSSSIKAKSFEITKSRQKTMMERYGGVAAMQVPELRAKIDATNLERYGDTNPAKNVEVRKKISEAARSEEVKSKYKATSLAHYGVEYPAQSEEIQYMMRKTCLEHYGVEYSHQIPEIVEKTQQTCLKKYGVPAAFLKPEAQLKARQTILANLDDKFTRVSKLNQSFADKLKEYELESEFEFYLAGKWYDIHILNTNILIEINPSYTHSEIPSHWMKTGLDSNYHKMKSDIASEYGYRCIHIFDWDNWDKIISTIVSKNKIYARNCKVDEIGFKISKEFLENYHLQGSTYSAKVCLGLYHEDELIEVMTFGRPRYTHKYEYELLRLCTKSDTTVIGGASKLYSYFLDKYDPQSILSYCDLAKFSGSIYEKLGMTLDHVSPPARIWSKGEEYVTDNLLRQRGYDQIFNTVHGKGTSNEELMLKAHWLPVYDCGQKVFVYYK